MAEAELAAQPLTKLIRWIAVIHYRCDAGLVDITVDLEEIGDIQEVVEAGPHWDTIERVEIIRALEPPSTLTVEGAAEQ